jgi:hypothetical protein
VSFLLFYVGLPAFTNVTCCVPIHRPFSVRHGGRNRGMTPQFEAHVRTMMATGGSGRQVRENLVLCANHFLHEKASLAYIKDIPTERWFLLQREALGVTLPNPPPKPYSNPNPNPHTKPHPHAYHAIGGVVPLLIFANSSQPARGPVGF